MNKRPDRSEAAEYYFTYIDQVPAGRRHVHFDGYPVESIADWHSKRRLTVD